MNDFPRTAAMQLQDVKTPKEFYIKERNQFYADWMIAFWREFFQNSVDAGAKNIAISITTEKTRGSFNLDADGDANVTRIVFDDDGIGMDASTLSEVYFAIGKSTKDGGTDSVGGFGRARLMTCFSQKRYSIMTKDSFVMGDGPQYVLYDLDEADRQLSEAIGNLRAAGGSSVAIDGLVMDRNQVVQAIAAGGRTGCRVEVDVEHVRKHAWSDMPDEQTMARRLKDYLSESQVPAVVTINGQTPEEYYGSDKKIQARRGPAKRTLSATLEDGSVVEFATVHTSESDAAAHKGKMIVRVDGASMFTDSISSTNKQVIVEIAREYSRQALNSNRDGLKDQFKEVVGEFLQELSTDNVSALAEKESKNSYRIEGQKGALKSTRPNPSTIAREAKLDDSDLAALHEITARQATKPSGRQTVTISSLKAAGLSHDVLQSFLVEFRYGDGFAAGLLWGKVDWEVEQQFQQLKTKLSEGDWGKEVDIFSEHASPLVQEWILSRLGEKIRAEKARIAEEMHDAKLKDEHDVYMHVISTNEKTKAAVARHHPKKWDAATGKGRLIKAQLAAWTAACAEAVENLRDARPSLEDFEWTTGFVVALPEDTYEGDGTRQRVIAGLHKKDGEEHVYLFNPFDEAGNLAYKLTSPADRQKILTIAMHEVAHTVSGSHNETYALTLTDLVERMDFAQAMRRMRAQERAVAAAYDKGRARVQALDDEDGPRPADVLQRMASGNEYGGRRDWKDDGTYDVDCDALADNVRTMTAEEAAPADEEDVDYEYAAQSRPGF